jgi:hypothetical protein
MSERASEGGWGKVDSLKAETETWSSSGSGSSGSGSGVVVQAQEGRRGTH